MGTGMSRCIDENGRIVLPIELRKQCGMSEGIPIDIRLDEGGKIVLERSKAVCMFCGGKKRLRSAFGQLICQSCAKKLINEWRNHDE